MPYLFSGVLAKGAKLGEAERRGARCGLRGWGISGCREVVLCEDVVGDLAEGGGFLGGEAFGDEGVGLDVVVEEKLVEDGGGEEAAGGIRMAGVELEGFAAIVVLAEDVAEIQGTGFVRGLACGGLAKSKVRSGVNVQRGVARAAWKASPTGTWRRW